MIHILLNNKKLQKNSNKMFCYYFFYVIITVIIKSWGVYMLKNRGLLIIFLLVFIMLLTIEPVYAASCKGLLTPGAYQILQDTVNVVRIIVPVLLIILGACDFASVVMSDDKDGLKKASSKFIKRCIAAIAIFFVPLVVRTLLKLPGIKENIVLVDDDPLCGVK